MPRIALLTPHLQRNDAVGHDTLFMERVLREAGHEVRIFAPNVQAGLKAHAPRTLADFLRAPDDILLYHYTVAYPEALEAFRSLRCRKVLKYHNVTPAEFFEPYHAGYADLCRRGRDMLREFVAAGADLYLGDSQFNVDELIALGAPRERCGVVAPLHAIDELESREADLATIARFTPDALESYKNILMVGRIAPNKGYEQLIRSFALYRERFNPNHARLILVGKADDLLALYTGRLRTLCRDLAVEDAVVFTGPVSPAELKSCYLTADVFAITSEHEGFCVPLVEAMAFALPIVALNRGAVGETLGDGGILWDAADPALFATSLHRLISQPELAAELGERGRARYERSFRNESIAADLVASLERLV